MRYRILLYPICLGVLAACASSGNPTTTTPERNTVTSEDLKDKAEPIERLLERKVPGLVVSHNSAGDLVLMIRGTSSHLANDTPPLYILDGSPYQTGPGGALVGINAEDIETVKVLKGPEAAIYGIDGANGVIVITTKRGGRRK